MVCSPTGTLSSTFFFFLPKLVKACCQGLLKVSSQQVLEFPTNAASKLGLETFVGWLFILSLSSVRNKSTWRMTSPDTCWVSYSKQSNHISLTSVKTTCTMRPPTGTEDKWLTMHHGQGKPCCFTVFNLHLLSKSCWEETKATVVCACKHTGFWCFTVKLTDLNWPSAH